ncbi:MFS transporter [Aliamphritea hakodatensis]|uniref:MFS transporter n=1 Tax=Aliamphritea hakodatensis TaxID=2895352 RepID=UPI0022FD98ED|nr:MFS transporter [Aliamphritea hakodatensis]
MTATLISLIALFLSGFVIFLGHGLNNILVPSRLASEGISADNIGLIMAMFSVGLLIGGLYARQLIVRVGHIRLFTASAAIGAISILACYLWLNEWMWAAMRACIGFSIAVITIVTDGWLSERATSETRSRILSINQVVLLSAMFLGSFLVNLAPVSDALLYIIGGLVFCAGVVPIALSKVSAPVVDDSPRMPMPELLKISPAGASSVFMCGLLLGSILSMLAVYAQNQGITGVDVSLLVGAAILGGFLLQFPIGYLADHYNRRTVILCVTLVSMIATALIPFTVGLDWFIITLLLVALSSGIMATLYPLGISESFDRLQQSQMSGAMGSMMIIYAVGGISGPSIAGFIMKHFGDNAFFTMLAVMHALFALFIFYRTKVRQAIPVDQQEAFVSQGATGMVSADLDPRTEYSDTAPQLSPAAQTAIDMATHHPELAIDMVMLIARANPEQVNEVAGAVATVEGIDVTELYNRLNELTPEQDTELAQSIIAASTEAPAELVSAVFEDAESEDIPELAASMAEAAPEQTLDIIEAATEAVLEDDNPEAVVEIAEAYLSNVSDNLEDMRYADRLADESEQNVTDMVSMIAEKAPEQAMDVAAAAVEAVPESASDVVEVLHEHDAIDDLVSDLKDKPEQP